MDERLCWINLIFVPIRGSQKSGSGKQQDIVRLCNLVNNPAYVHLEDAGFEAAIPILESVGVV